MSKSKPGFWKELKRRGVPRVLAMYAATAFIIMEASEIMLPRLGLPDWTVTFVIILLIVGLPVAIVLSWVFDITPQGVVKTGPIEEVEQSGEVKEARRRKLKLSDGIIVVLLIAVATLAYPKIFGKEDSRLRRKMPDQISIAVMPFKNMTGDTLFNLWQGGMQNLLITSLSNSEELSVRQFETMNSLVNGKADLNYAGLTPSLAGEMARKVEANTVISGNLHKSGTKVRITANIMSTETEEIYKSYEMEGKGEDELFELADSLSIMLRDFLVITNMKQNQLFDVRNVFTNSPEAYKYYLQGFDCHNRLDYSCAADFYNKAIQVDSNFVSAMMQLAYCYADQQLAQQSKYWAYEAFERIDQLPFDMQIMVRQVKSVADKKPLDQLEYARQYLEHHPYSAYMTYMEGWINFNLENWEESVKGFENSLNLLKKLDVHSWAWTYILLGGAYHNLGSHNKEQKVFEEGREFWPEQKSTFDYWQAICAVSQGDSIQAASYLEEIRIMLEQRGWPEANILAWYAGVYNNAESFELAEFYYRKVQSLRPGDDYLNADLSRFLITNDINLEEGLELITPLVEKYPENASFLYTYGLGLFKQGEYQLSKEVLQRSWDLNPYYDHKHFLLNKEIYDILTSK
jgi:TolB-like protein